MSNIENKPKAIEQRNIVDGVLVRVKELESLNAIKIPKDYSVENSLKFAYLILVETVDRDKNPALSVCTAESIGNALLDMVVKGLNPAKKQCYFIVRGKKLTMMPSYFGNVHLAKTLGGIKNVVANIIYKDDVFEYEIDTVSGRKKVLKHEQKLDNIDIGKIKGAYATVEFQDGSTDVEPMTYAQILKAWDQGDMKGNSGAHKNFTDQMAKRTVINRACKSIINSSDDSSLELPESDDNESTFAIVQEEIKENANKGGPIGFEETQTIEIKEQPKEENNPATNGTGNSSTKPGPSF